MQPLAWEKESVMKNNNMDSSLRTALLALLIAALVIAIFLIPLPQAQAPQVELLPEQHFVERAEAKEVEVVLATPPALVEMLKPVCSCESVGTPDGEPQHFERDGVTVLTGRHNPRDVGMCQINLDAHEETIEAMGLDVFKRDDNIEYANWLYSTQGLKPWVYSKPCWQHSI